MKSKQCKECGREFTPRSGTQLYCSGPHQTRCECCGRILEYKCSPKEKPHYCSKACITNGRKQTVQAKYGVDNVSELQEIKDKISKANSSEEVTSKRKATCICNWGVDNVAKNIEIRAKLSDVMKTDEYLQGREQTCLSKYGHTTPMGALEVKAKRAQTCIDRYGIPGHLASKEFIEKRMLDPSKIGNYLEFKSNPIDFIQTRYKEPPSIYQLETDLGVTNTPIYDILVSNDCSDLIKHSYSNMEDDVCSFLYSIIPNIHIIRNDRKIISPKEIDIYLPDYQLGIECNPASTHNSSIVDAWGSTPKYYKYHQQKSLEAAAHKVFLFHVFGYEWVNHRGIIESMLCNLLHVNSTSIGGRNTYVCDVSHLECKNFLQANHRQGYTSSLVRLGLRLKSDDTLVSVMTFSHLRNTMGKTKDSTLDDWELSRFCTKTGVNISGGASKLFSYFLKMYSPHSILSFSDIAHTKGGLYEKLGFNQVSMSSPSYVWSDIYDNRYFHRVSCQKQYLKKLLGDNSIDIDNCTEREIMESHKYVRIYDSGVIKWLYTSH